MAERRSTALAEMLHSAPWQAVLAAFRERKQAWESQLLRNPDLSEAERRAYILMRKELLAVFDTLYTMAGMRLDDELGLV